MINKREESARISFGTGKRGSTASRERRTVLDASSNGCVLRILEGDEGYLDLTFRNGHACTSGGRRSKAKKDEGLSSKGDASSSERVEELTGGRDRASGRSARRRPQSKLDRYPGKGDEKWKECDRNQPQ